MSEQWTSIIISVVLVLSFKTNSVFSVKAFLPEIYWRSLGIASDVEKVNKLTLTHTHTHTHICSHTHTHAHTHTASKIPALLLGVQATEWQDCTGVYY